MPPLSSQPSALFQARRQSLQIRVNEAAQTLRDQGIPPTVARIRTALGGGSPNDLAPALKHWKESILPTLSSSGSCDTSAPLPRQVADLTQELWQRSLTAAMLEMQPQAPPNVELPGLAQFHQFQMTGAAFGRQLQAPDIIWAEPG